VLINPIIYAELAGYADSELQMASILSDMLLERADLPWEAAFLAGRAFVAYRRAGGARSAPLPDFYIGAHAQVSGLTLLTRDVRRYRTYFPAVSLIAPDAS
jgi:predicted nucleic acid-binding protein